MPEYRVTLTLPVTMMIEAESEKDAEEFAYDELANDFEENVVTSFVTADIEELEAE